MGLETNLERNTKYNGTSYLIAFFYSSLYPSKYEHCTSLTCQLLFQMFLLQRFLKTKLFYTLITVLTVNTCTLILHSQNASIRCEFFVRKHVLATVDFPS